MTVFVDPLSEEVWRTTYKWRDDLTIDDTLARVASAVASVEPTEETRRYWARRFLDMLTDFKVTAGGRIYANAGTSWHGTTLMNCFVSPRPDNPADSIEGIYETLLDQALTLKSEGGWGHNFSALRPRGAFVSGIGVGSPGAVSFMDLFDQSSAIVTSGPGTTGNAEKGGKGKIRKGAMMAVLDVWHPDVVEFVTAKQIPGKLTKFNVSVNCTDDFMDKILRVQEMEREGRPRSEIDEVDRWDLVFPDTSHPAYDRLWDGDIRAWKEKGLPVVVHRTVSASWLWNLIMESTYRRAEPGVLFLDRANQWFGSPFVYRITATNPCLVAETEVTLTDGSKRTIADIAEAVAKGVCIHVCALDTRKGTIGTDTVVGGGVTKTDAEIVELRTVDGHRLRCTPDHRIYTLGRGWVEAACLRLDDKILAYGGTTGVEEIRMIGRADVWDLTTMKHHNFFAEDLCVHNCGEQTLPPGGSCNLGSLNLTAFVREHEGDFDLAAIDRHTRDLVRFLDDVNDLTRLPLPEYEEFVRRKRRVGVGVMGWGSALLMLRTRLGSDRAAELREQVMSTIARAAWSASVDLAEEKGAFEGSDGEKHVETPYVRSLGLPDEVMEKMRRFGVRNSSLLSCQPTGNTSILANVVSGGIEPVFCAQYVRTVTVPTTPEHLREVTPRWWMGEFEETSFFRRAKEGDEEILRGVDADGTVWKIDRNRGLCREVECIDYGVRWLMQRDLWDPDADWAVTAMDLTVDDHVSDLAGFARWVDSSISKTINVPHDYPFEDFRKVYTEAYRTGTIKGVTTYRAGTMTSVVSAKSKPADNGEEIILDDVKLPDSGPATLKVLRAEGKKWYLTVVMSEDGSRPIALFVQTNSHEKNIVTRDAVEKLTELARAKGIPERHITSTLEKIKGDNNATQVARMVSLNLRHGVRVASVVAALHAVGAPLGSFVSRLKRFLSEFVREGERVANRKCSHCGSENIVFSEGCTKCANCGSSKCS